MATQRKGSLPASLKWTVEQRTEKWIESTFRPLIPDLAAEAKRHGFNYPEKIFTRRRGRYFYIGVTYREVQDEESFDILTTRLEQAGGQTIHLSYMRHTGRWCEVFRSLTVDECFETLESMQLFWPLS